MRLCWSIGRAFPWIKRTVIWGKMLSLGQREVGERLRWKWSPMMGEKMKRRNQCHSKKNGKAVLGRLQIHSSSQVEEAYLWEKQIHTRVLGEEKHNIPLCSTLMRNVQSMIYLLCKFFRATLDVLDWFREVVWNLWEFSGHRKYYIYFPGAKFWSLYTL